MLSPIFQGQPVLQPSECARRMGVTYEMEWVSIADPKLSSGVDLGLYVLEVMSQLRFLRSKGMDNISMHDRENAGQHKKTNFIH